MYGGPARRELECAANDLHTNSLIAFQFEVIERLLGAKVSNASASNDTLLDGCAGRMQGILHARLLLLHFCLRRGADTYHRNAACELSQTLLEFLAMVLVQSLNLGPIWQASD